MNIIIRTFEGFEEILAEEVFHITEIKPEIGKRAVYIKGDLRTIYNLNLRSRLALDVLVELHKYKASNESQLYKGAYSFDWGNEFSIHETFSISSIVHSPFFNHSKYVSLKIKDAIVDQFNKNNGTRPNVDRVAPDHKFIVRVTHDQVNLLWNTSGDPLFKRGYRTITGVAPLNEVLAAGILKFSGWSSETPLIDPMCGSGTFICEALMMAKNMPPSIRRDRFGFMNHKDYDHHLWLEIKENATEKINKKVPNIRGSDIMSKMVSATKNNLDNILKNHPCKMETKDFFKLKKLGENNMLVLNPPYNIRIAKEKNHEFYNDIGTQLKHEWSGCDAWILTGDLEGLKYIGLRPRRKIKMFNGPIETRLINIPLYKGSKKTKKSQIN